MNRAPGSRSVTLPGAGLLVALLAVAVLGGTVYGWTQWQQAIDEATAVDPAGTSGDDHGEGLPTASASPTDQREREPERDAYEPPTFEALEPTGNRPSPVVLLVGDGYAAGRGASSQATAYPSLLARDTGWDIRLATDPGAGYTVPGADGQTLPELFAASPTALDPDLVVVQGGYGGDASSGEVKRAIADLRAAIMERWPGVPVVAVTPFWPGQPMEKSDLRERAVARAWRDSGEVLVLRPQPEGWSDFTTVDGAPDDSGHELIAASLVEAWRSAAGTLTHRRYLAVTARPTCHRLRQWQGHPSDSRTPHG